jgi:type II secretory pathway predicted ATPase ExeA
MIRAWFAIDKTPFDTDGLALMPHQAEILDVIRVHAQQGGLCLVIGEPGTGKSVLKRAIIDHDPRRMITPALSRTLHTYHNTLRILCQLCELDTDGSDFRCERRLIDHALRVNQAAKMLVPIIDDAHLIDIHCLRKLRLLLEDFPKNHNLVLIGHPELLPRIQLSVNADIRSRITYSALLTKLNPDQIRQFILDQLERAGLGHNVLSEEALELLVRSAAGVLRAARNLTVSTLLEAARDRTKTAGIKQVNRVLIQPHWRNCNELDKG